jgi:hypothetical protein
MSYPNFSEEEIAQRGQELYPTSLASELISLMILM